MNNRNCKHCKLDVGYIYMIEPNSPGLAHLDCVSACADRRREAYQKVPDSVEQYGPLNGSYKQGYLAISEEDAVVRVDKIYEQFPGPWTVEC